MEPMRFIVYKTNFEIMQQKISSNIDIELIFIFNFKEWKIEIIKLFN